VRRGSATLFDTDDLNIGQKVRMFGLLSTGAPPYTLDVTTGSDVIRMEPTWIAGLANAAPASALAELDLVRVDVRDAGIFDWTDGGLTPADPDAFVVSDPGLSTGQGIANGTPVVALGFFSAVDDNNVDFVPLVLANRDLLPSVLLVRDRTNGMATVVTTSPTAIDFTFSGAQSGLESAVVDQGFAGEVDVSPTGVSIVPKPGTLGFGLYLLHDRTLSTFQVFLTFSGFAQAVDDALTGGATLFNVGSLGVFDDVNDRMPSNWTAITVQ